MHKLYKFEIYVFVNKMKWFDWLVDNYFAAKIWKLL